MLSNTSLEFTTQYKFMVKTPENPIPWHRRKDDQQNQLSLHYWCIRRKFDEIPIQGGNQGEAGHFDVAKTVCNLILSPLSERRVALISRTQSSELDLWMADILLSLVNVNRPMVSKLVSRWRTHDIWKYRAGWLNRMVPPKVELLSDVLQKITTYLSQTAYGMFS